MGQIKVLTYFDMQLRALFVFDNGPEGLTYRIEESAFSNS